MVDHYFSETPNSPAKITRVSMSLANTPLTLETSSGTFSSAGLDRGTAILLHRAPDPPTEGVFVDVGCGWGPIALTLALLSPQASVYAVDVNERARHLTGANAATAGVTNVTVVSPEDFPAELAVDLIWSNPPIRIGKAALHTLLRLWLARLSETGEAWLVVAKQLGGDSLQRWINAGEAGAFSCTREATDKGYRILRVTRSTG